MTSMKLACLALVAALLVIVSAPGARATSQEIAYISPTGSDSNSCTAAQPCATIAGATNTLYAGGQVSCINTPNIAQATGTLYYGMSLTFAIDCVGVDAAASGGINSDLQFSGGDQAIKISNLTFSGSQGAGVAIEVTGAGTLILEKCIFENFSGVALEIEPTGPFNLVIRDSRISNSASGVLIEPGSGGSVKARLLAEYPMQENGEFR
jgi:hypothetical protein